jgi:hypothetical protein
VDIVQDLGTEKGFLRAALERFEGSQ